MIRNNTVKRAFYVVQFIELPFEGIDDYVCVPGSWLIVRRATDQKAVIAYPKDEDPFVTRDRARRKERCDDEWRFYMAAVKYESDSYRDAEYWIATRNDYGPLVEEDSAITNTPPRFTLNKKLQSANQHRSMKRSTKRPAVPEPKKQLHEKRLKLDEVAQSSSAVVDDANAEPGCSKLEQPIIIQDNQSRECAQTHAAAATNANESIEPKTETQQIDVDESTEVIIIDEEDHPQGARSEQTTQPNQHNNQEHIVESRNSLPNFQPRIESVRSIATTCNDHEVHVNDVSNTEPSTSHAVLSSLKISTQLYSQINRARRLVPMQKPVEKWIRPMNIEKNLAIAAQSPSNLMDETGSLLTRSVEQPSEVTLNQAVGPQLLKMHTGNSRDKTAPLRSFAISSRENQHVPSNVERSHDVAVDPRNVFHNVSNIASASRNPASSSYQRPNFIQQLNGQQSSPTQEQNLTHHYQNLTINQNRFEQDSHHRGFPESNNYDLQPNTRTKRMRISSIRLNSNQIDQISELPQQRQSQQDSVPQLQRPKIRIDITIKPKNNKQISTLEGVTKKMLPNLRSKIRNSIQQALSITPDNYLLNEQQLQTKLSAKSTKYNHTGLSTGPQNIEASATRDNHNSEVPTCSFHQSPRIQHNIPTGHENMYQNLRTPRQVVNQCIETNSNAERVHDIDDVARSTVNESHLGVMDNACQTDERMLEGTQAPYHAVTPDSGVETDREVISNHDMPTDETPVETTNNVDCTGITSGRFLSDRPMAAQKSMSPDHRNHPRVVLEQQMLDNFATLFTQMGSTLRYTCDMYNNLRSSIFETATTYRCLIDAVEQFNTLGNSARTRSTSSNLTPEVQQAAEERHIEVTARPNSSNEGPYSNDVPNKEPEKKHNNLWRFVLPPEYDSHDTRWTLKYRTNMPGLVELMPQSGIYVGYGELKYCQRVSKDCSSLARRLLQEVFSREALSVCLSMHEKAQATNNVGSNVRPALDEHACTVLLHFVSEYGLQCGWNTDLQRIISTLHSKIQKIRFRYGVMVKC